MKLNYNNPSGAARKGFTLVELLVVMAIIAVLASVAVPTVLDKLKVAERNKAIQQLKGLNNVLTSFKTDYGTFPGQQIVDNDQLEGASASDANACWRQLFQAGELETESAFSIKSEITIEADGDIGEEPEYAQALEPGECGYMYMDNPRAKSGAPLAAAPLTRSPGEFDFISYDGKAVVLTREGTVKVLDINEDTGKVESKFGGSNKDIFSSANPNFREQPNPKYPVAK